MAFEQPLKKRRRYDMFGMDGTPGLDPKSKLPIILSVAEEFESTQRPKLQDRRVHHGAYDHRSRDYNLDEKLKKRRNREEISNIYKAYRRLKFCLASPDELNPDVREDMEVAYNAMLELSTGCTSVRRIAAELIPRYAVFCPSALEAALQATLQLCDWSNVMVWQGSDGDGIVGKTAEACYSGLVLLSAAAVTAAPELSSMGVMCTAVCRNVAVYLLRQLNGRLFFTTQGKPISLVGDYKVAPESKSLGNLGVLVSASLCRVFTGDPEGVLAACFDLLRATDIEQRQDGHHFLSEIMKPAIHVDEPGPHETKAQVVLKPALTTDDIPQKEADEEVPVTLVAKMA